MWISCPLSAFLTWLPFYCHLLPEASLSGCFKNCQKEYWWPKYGQVETNAFFQIFLRVAEETGVDAEPEWQAESPNRQQPSAGQRVERQEEPETGMHAHTHIHVVLCSYHTVFPCMVCLLFCLQLLLFVSIMLPGRKRLRKQGISHQCLKSNCLKKEAFIFTFYLLELTNIGNLTD